MNNKLFVFASILILLASFSYFAFAEARSNRTTAGNLTDLQIRTNRTISRNITELQNRFQERLEFREQIKEQITLCKQNRSYLNASLNCSQARENGRKIAIGYINKVCNNFSEYLDKLENRILNNVKLNEDEKENLTRLLEDKKGQLEDICNQVNEETNISKIKELFLELRTLIRDTKEELEIGLGFCHRHRIGLVFQRMFHLENNLERFLQNYKGNKTRIELLLEQFRTRIREANAHYNESIRLFEEARNMIRNRERASEKIREANARMQQAQVELREAHRVLMQIVQEIKLNNEKIKNSSKGKR